MPLLSEPLANVVDFLAPTPPTAPGVHTISLLSPTSNEASSLSNLSGPHSDNSDEGPLNVSPPTHASNAHEPEDTVIGEASTEGQGTSASDLSTDVDSVPSLIDTSESDHLFSSPNVEGSRGAPENLQRDRESVL
jgi:hypothetical protein